MTGNIFDDLPGIADDSEPTVFETDEVHHQTDQNYFFTESDSDTVHVISLPVSEVFAKFSDKTLDATTADFSDAIKQQHNTGYYAGCSGDTATRRYRDEERQGRTNVGSDSSLSQRYRRLDEQLRSLSQQLLTEKDEGNDKARLDEIEEQSRAVQQLLVQLRDLATMAGDAEGSQPHNCGDPSEPNYQDSSQLISFLQGQLENWQLGDSHTAATSANTAGSTADDVTYQLHVRAQLTAADRLTQLSALQLRLQAAEAAVGANADDLERLFADTRQRSLLGVVHTLMARSSLLAPEILRPVVGRLATLLGRFTTLVKQQEQQQQQVEQQSDEQHQQQRKEELRKMHMLSELADTMKQVEPTRMQLANIVERLKSLQTVHHTAAELCGRLGQLDLCQQQLAASSDRWLSETAQVRSACDAGVQAVNATLDTVQVQLDNAK